MNRSRERKQLSVVRLYTVTYLKTFNIFECVGKISALVTVCFADIHRRGSIFQDYVIGTIRQKNRSDRTLSV